MMYGKLAGALMGGACIVAVATPAAAQTHTYNIPAGSLKTALDAFGRASGRPIIYKADEIRRARSPGARGNLSADAALTAILSGTGFTFRADSSGAIAIISGETEAGSVAADSVGADIIVTGSHIRGVNPTSPVHTVTSKDIEQSGYSQIGDLIRSLPENWSGGQNPGVFAASSTNVANTNGSNSSTINLRGLGTDATLVLVNGHRLSSDYAFQGADISGIPLSAVERIEIVPDGASALYGSDAVAGVANIILRKTFNGAEVSANVGGATQGGGFEQTYNALAGASRASWYLLASAEYSKQTGITASQRDFTSLATPESALLQPQTRKSLFLNGGVNFSDNVTLSFDGIVSERKARGSAQSDPAYGGSTSATRTPAHSIATTLDIALPNSWKVRAMGVISASKNHNVIRVGGVDYRDRYTNSIKYVEILADGALFQIPSGPVKVAVGGGYRRELFSNDGDLGVPVNASRNVSYLFGELSLPLVSPSDDRPLLNELFLSASGRVEHYSDFGGTANPKIGVRYIPFKGMSIRGSWGTSFKSPSFLQLYYKSYAYLFPATVLGYSGNLPNATALFEDGGNRNLRPEQSTSWTIGADYVPTFAKTMTISTTYFDIDYTDRVVQPINPLTQALADPKFAPFVQYSPSEEQVTDAISGVDVFYNYTGSDVDPVNVIAVAHNNYQNATAQRVRGVDVSYRQTFSLEASNLSAFAGATWISLKQRTDPSLPASRLSGTIFNVPSFKARGGLSWQRGGLSATGILNYVSGETDTGVSPNVPISSWTTVDANLAYEFSEEHGPLAGVTVALAASNLFDAAPPRAISPSISYQGIYYDSTNSSIVGRFVSVKVAKRW